MCWEVMAARLNNTKYSARSMSQAQQDEEENCSRIVVILHKTEEETGRDLVPKARKFV